ncbi:MAG: divergent polysaccharide deacetylase family protein [Kiloniellales bacterium]
MALAMGGLLLASLFGGGLLGVTLDRAGLLDRLAEWNAPPASALAENQAVEGQAADGDAGGQEATFAALGPAPHWTPAPAPARTATWERFAQFDRERLGVEPQLEGPAEVLSEIAPGAGPGSAGGVTEARGALPPLGSAAAVSLAALVAESLQAANESQTGRAEAHGPAALAEWQPPSDVQHESGNELHLVYEEPPAARDHLPPPSDQTLDSFVAERRLAGIGLGSAGAGTPAWQRNAVQVADVGARPMIALVLDDLGLNRPATRRAVALPGPLTLAFMTYAEHIEGMLAEARAGGHELLVHMPMEPRDPNYDPGPNALAAELSPQELARRIAWGLERFEGYVGINNHMGSRFTTSLPGMAQVMQELRKRGLLFLDSKTAGASVGSGLATRMGVPYAERDIFIDNDHEDRAAIERQLDALEALARRRGFAVGIGHPHRVTLDVLERWLPAVQRRGFALVPISAVVHRRIELARAAAHAG